MYSCDTPIHRDNKATTTNTTTTAMAPNDTRGNNDDDDESMMTTSMVLDDATREDLKKYLCDDQGLEGSQAHDRVRGVVGLICKILVEEEGEVGEVLPSGSRGVMAFVACYGRQIHHYVTASQTHHHHEKDDDDHHHEQQQQAWEDLMDYVEARHYCVSDE